MGNIQKLGPKIERNWRPRRERRWFSRPQGNAMPAMSKTEWCIDKSQSEDEYQQHQINVSINSKPIKVFWFRSWCHEVNLWRNSFLAILVCHSRCIFTIERMPLKTSIVSALFFSHSTIWESLNLPHNWIGTKWNEF